MDHLEVLLLGMIAFFAVLLISAILVTKDNADDCRDRGGRYYEGLCLKKELLLEK